jgi:NAD(P)H-flavin reductase
MTPILKKRRITLREKVHEGGDIYTFILNYEGKIDWKPGYHGMFWIDGKKIKGRSYRGFSLASHPEEREIWISTRIREPISDFKKKLMDMQPGDTMTMRGPFGWMFFHNKKDVVMIAGGIGITPFRALLLQAEKENRKATLFYSTSKGNYAYLKFLDTVNAANPNIDVHYLGDRTHLTEVVEKYVKDHGNDSEYFISGSMEMIRSMKKKLKELGIKGKNIRNEPMLYY